MDKTLTRASKFISLVLRHKPEAHGLQLDAHGWARIDDLIAAAARAGIPLTRQMIDQVVAENDKQRFAISADGSAIRARQGHSIQVDLGLAPVAPPDLLFHGTADRAIPAIREQGLQRRSRQHVHLSATIETAVSVGARHGRPVVITVQAGRMHADGHHFYQAENGVWLADEVPIAYLIFPPEA
jgi:putative RNA 2'-phosphotransferase